MVCVKADRYLPTHPPRYLLLGAKLPGPQGYGPRPTKIALGRRAQRRTDIYPPTRPVSFFGSIRSRSLVATGKIFSPTRPGIFIREFLCSLHQGRWAKFHEGSSGMACVKADRSLPDRPDSFFGSFCSKSLQATGQIFSPNPGAFTPSPSRRGGRGQKGGRRGEFKKGLRGLPPKS